MPLIGDRDLVRIDLPADGEWVDVKRKLSRGDEIAVQRAVADTATVNMSAAVQPKPKVRPSGDGEEQPAKDDSADFGLNAGAAIEAAEFALLYLVVKSWSFPEPVTKANIRCLDPASVECIKARLDEMYEPPLSEDESRNLERNGATPSTEREESLAV